MALMLVNCRERKNPLTSKTTTMTANGVACEKAAQAAIKQALTNALATSTVRKPKCSRILAATAFMVNAPSAAENVTSPDWNGSSLKPSCIISGNRNGSAPTPTRNRNPPNKLARKVGKTSNNKSGSESSTRRERITKATIESASPTINPATTDARKSLTPATESPN